MGNPLMGLQIGGQVQQDLSRYIGSIAKNMAMQRGIVAARGDITSAYGTARGYQLPWLRAGEAALGRMSAGSQSGEFTAPERQAKDYGTYQAPAFDFQADPGYQFRRQEGMSAAQGSAAARGMGLSGATMRAMQRYGQNLASQEYANAYGRYAQDRAFGAGQFGSNRAFAYGQDTDLYNSEVGRRAALWNQFSGLSGLGQSAANNLSNMASAYGDQMGNLSLSSATTLRNAYQDAQDASVLQGQGAKDFGGMGGGMGGMMGGGGGGGEGAAIGSSPSYQDMGGMGDLSSRRSSLGWGQQSAPIEQINYDVARDPYEGMA